MEKIKTFEGLFSKENVQYIRPDMSLEEFRNIFEQMYMTITNSVQHNQLYFFKFGNDFVVMKDFSTFNNTEKDSKMLVFNSSEGVIKLTVIRVPRFDVIEDPEEEIEFYRDAINCWVDGGDCKRYGLFTAFNNKPYSGVKTVNSFVIDTVVEEYVRLKKYDYLLVLI